MEMKITELIFDKDSKLPFHFEEVFFFNFLILDCLIMPVGAIGYHLMGLL